ncbi:aldehyde dehydrogenase [Pyrenophora seminiperda CCB06]|uniref:aldehyde dehydrogenase (NAD(+)) n=1 Tax=Pyrenophora seminiperda CCB06 TaxID=1302712 RepID=A0A3M7ME24_9PLEO|nr:aldehyde dehydrogenase [Pyrenophora seminiperda CCB06]
MNSYKQGNPTPTMSSIEFDLTRYPIPIQLFINGEWIDSKTKKTQSLSSAVNDQVICRDIHWADCEDIDYAVESAASGLQTWRAFTKRERREALVRYAQLLREHHEEIFWLEAILTGKAKSFSTYEVDAAAETFLYFANSIDTFNGQLVSQEDNCIKYVTHQPYGICAAIVPFNGPVVCYSMKAAPALATGNALIVKASELNPFSTLFAVSLAVKAGIPPGVINCVTGDAVTGNALAMHMKIRKISLTGSLPTARAIQAASAQSNLKSVTVQLGGKSPVIVFPDADLDKAAESCCQFLMLNGQGCMLGTRIYLHETVFEEIMPKIKATVQAYEDNLQGDPFSEGTWSSPLFHHRQREIVVQHIEKGKTEATLLPGGGEVLPGKGCYIRPAIFTNPSPTASILKSEVFGPVIVVSTFKEEDEVIEAANDSELGLGACIWTRDIGRALRVSSKIEAGSIGVNGITHVPWEANTCTSGWKQSGQGVENGVAAMLDWTQTKSVKIAA